MLTADELRQIRRLHLQASRKVSSPFSGEYRSAFRGQGMEFEEVRPYVPGNDVRRIDWNVTARTDTPHVREYLEDRDVTTWLLLDRSQSMGFGPIERRKHLVLAELAATVAQLLTRGGNRIGAVLFDSEVDEVLRPASGRNQVLRILSRLLLTPPVKAGRRTTALAVPLRAALGIARRRSLVVIISDFITEPGWERPLAQLAHRHDVVALQVVDRREFELPPVGMIYVEDAETGEQIFVNSDDPAFQRRLQAAAQARQSALSAATRRAGVDLFTVATDEDLVRSLARIAELRRRRRR